MDDWLGISVDDLLVDMERLIEKIKLQPRCDMVIIYGDIDNLSEEELEAGKALSSVGDVQFNMYVERGIVYFLNPNESLKKLLNKYRGDSVKMVEFKDKKQCDRIDISDRYEMAKPTYFLAQQALSSYSFLVKGD